MLNVNPLPKYYRLAKILRDDIISGKLKPDDQLPSEESLSKTHQVSRGTVREAIRTLIEEGLIRREHGRGTFVSSPQPRNTLFTLTSFDEDMRRQNRQPSTKILTAEVIPATPEVAGRLELTVGEPVIHVVRLRLADGQPVAYEKRNMAYSLCPHLLDENLQATSIHRLLTHKYQISLVRMVHTVEVGRLTTKQAELLQTRAGVTAFFVDRLTYTEKDGRKYPAVWFWAIYREDNYNIRAKFQPLPEI